MNSIVNMHSVWEEVCLLLIMEATCRFVRLLIPHLIGIEDYSENIFT